MIRRLLFLSVLFIGLNLVLAKNNWKSRSLHGRQYSPIKGQMRTLHGEKEQEISLNNDVTTTTTPSAPVVPEAPVVFGEIACLAACHSCVAADSFVGHNKKAADNCGPMCDCADSCFLMPAEEVGQIYGQPFNHRVGKDCWWKTYTDMLSSGAATSS